MTDTVYKKSDFAGRTIVQVANDNPRRAGTQGHESFEILVKAGGRMKYEAYLAEGGRTQDLKWDLAHGYVKLGPVRKNKAFLLAA